MAVTGGTGFVGRHLARALTMSGYEIVLVARGKDHRDAAVYEMPGSTFFAANLSSTSELANAFSGCDAVVHCAGINREIGEQTYERVHVQGTRNVAEACRAAGVRKLVLLSFLRARPDCGSAYHESKWAAEEIVRTSRLDYTIFKAGVIYGRGDHLLDHLSHALFTFPLFGLLGIRERPMRPLAVEDLVRAIERSLQEPRFSRKTFAITGPEELTLREVVARVGQAIGTRPIFVPLPIAMHKVIAWFAELVMRIPLLSLAQVRILAEGLVEATPPFEALPEEALPRTNFTLEQIRKGLPDPGPFGLRDLRCVKS